MPRDAIPAFWSWWATASASFAEAFDARAKPADDLIAAMNAHVAHIDAGLDWEFGAGVASTHHLCLSGKGDPIRRAVAERWVKLGPPADAPWEYYSARQATRGTDLQFQLRDVNLAFSALTFEIEDDAAREVVHVRAFHPAFPSLDDGERRTVLFIALDNLLGEDGVERWLGAVEVLADAPNEAIGYAALREHIDALAARAKREGWAILRGTRDGAPIFVTTNLALKRIDHPHLDMHLVVDLKLLTPTEQGLTTSDEADALNAMEDDLVAALGDDGVLVGRETTNGRRAIHLRTMEGGPARSILERWLIRHPDREAHVEATMDPRWKETQRWE